MSDSVGQEDDRIQEIVEHHRQDRRRLLGIGIIVRLLQMNHKICRVIRFGNDNMPVGREEYIGEGPSKV